ncbi:MAG: hypothetical protein ACLU4N_17660 [Butyricimonas faecihominis]
MNSYFGRLTYNYKEKYNFETTLRRDGSSVFGEKVRWATFLLLLRMGFFRRIIYGSVLLVKLCKVRPVGENPDRNSVNLIWLMD